MATISEALAIAVKHHQSGNLAQAEQIYRQILEMVPNHPETLQLLGLVVHEDGRHEFAIQCLQRAIDLDGRQAHFQNNLGEVYRRLARIPEAVECFDRALQMDPEMAEAHNNLGQTFMGRANVEEAIACYCRALRCNKNFPEAHKNLGDALKQQGKLNEAVACYRRAVEERPNYAEAHNALGIALADRGDMGWAMACYQRALELKANYPECHANLGNALVDEGRLTDAIASYRRALELRPDFAEVYVNLGIALRGQGRLDEAIACLRHALELRPNHANAYHSLLLSLQYTSGVTLSDLNAWHAEYEHRHAAPWRAGWRPHQNARDAERRLRVGFVSPDFGRHPVGYFLVRAIENFDHRQLETVCYSDRIEPDDITARFQAAAGIWRNVCGMTHEALAERIRADRVDILFDLAGHTAGNRLLVFARKPAPIQITWLGYVGTTGMGAMDYILANQYEVPPEREPYYSERVLRMPHGYVCYDPRRRLGHCRP